MIRTPLVSFIVILSAAKDLLLVASHLDWNDERHYPTIAIRQ
jgi:hypothetical protein